MGIEVIICKNFEFSAGHHLPNYEGDCSEKHGHNYDLTVYIKGSVNPDTGMVMDYRDLKKVVKEHVIAHLNHSYLRFFSV